MTWFGVARLAVWLKRAALALESIARSLEYLTAADRTAAEAVMRRRTLKPRKVEFGTMDPDAATARWEHERVEDGFVDNGDGDQR